MPESRLVLVGVGGQNSGPNLPASNVLGYPEDLGELAIAVEIIGRNAQGGESSSHS